MREVKRLSESVRKENDSQTCFEYVLKFGPAGPTEDQNDDLFDAGDENPVKNDGGVEVDIILS